MTRLMGDAIHDNVAQLASVPGLQLVAGYVTGSSDILWTTPDWNRFPGIPHVTIDQGYTGSPVPTAIVRDVEPGAWTPAAAVNRSNWTAARPTIYCDQNDLSRAGGVLASGWQGDLWIAIPGWQPGHSLPAAPGCNIVAVQNQLDVNAAYDLSQVIDQLWPIGGPVAVTAWQPGSVHILYSPTGQMQISGVAQDNAIYVANLNPDFTTSVPQQVTAPLTFT
jgi:hypothetical protein